MAKKTLFISVFFIWIMAGCGMMQSIVKSTLPYTSTLTIPASAEIGTPHNVINTASSFDQNFSINGKNSRHVSDVSVISARLEASEPADYNVGNLSVVKIYVSQDDGKNEQLIAWNNEIATTTGNFVTLDVDNTRFLDRLVQQPNIRIRMAYQLRQKTNADANLRLVMNINAYPAGK